MTDFRKQTTVETAAELGTWAASSAVRGREGAAYVWAYGAAHFGHKALAAGARLTRLGWVSGDLPHAGRDLARLADDLESKARAFESHPPELRRYTGAEVARTLRGFKPAPGDTCRDCRPGRVCHACRKLLDRYGEPGRPRS